MASKKETKSKKADLISVKKSAPKKSSVAPVAVEEIDEHDEEEIGALETKGKAKKPVEIDAADILPEVDEKIVDEENPLIASEEEESDDEVSLDDEDLNPFGDKWEQ